MPDHCRHVQGEEEEEEQKVPMILVAQAIVHECAVVIEALDALVAVVAVHRVFGPKILAVNADVIQMQLFIHEPFHEAEEVFFERHIAWVDQRQAVEDYG